ncbi:conserved hypothetical protein [Histoplasma capsulatum H143]|uniref:Uncharacterized protein n=1 Tax=Ajellomyces capsulatus (strain H143) TaxID=544712 RepID=C6H915_AJECH|nr:conserved hypothetical protein [Histoplasma capsulatum H143]
MTDWNSRNPPYWAWRVAREKSTNAASCEDRTVVFEESWYAGVLQFEVSQHATVSAAPLSLETSQPSAKLRICTQDIRDYVPRWLIRRQQVVHTSVRSLSHSTRVIDQWVPPFSAYLRSMSVQKARKKNGQWLPV